MTGRGILDCEGVVEGNHVSCEAVAERGEALEGEDVYARVRDGRCVCLVELVNVVRRNE